MGTPEQVAEQLVELNEAGMEVMTTGMADYNEEMTYFGAEIMPLLKHAGFRHRPTDRFP